MTTPRKFSLILTCFIVLAIGGIANAAKVSGRSTSILDATVDLTRLNIAPHNATKNDKTDDTKAIQKGINYLAKRGGGTLIFPPGLYRINKLVIKPGVRIVGVHRQATIFRTSGPHPMFKMKGGELHNFTAYGTPSRAGSGQNWKVGTKGKGKGGTARAWSIISVGDLPDFIAKDVLISNVTAKEARYDCLYTNGSKGLRVINCKFNRAGRNVVSMVGNDQDFLFEGCYIGSLWGLYQCDIEPNKGLFVRDGVFLNCTFNGSRAGQRDTDSWGKMMIFSGNENLTDRNVAVVGCKFNQIAIRIRGVFPQVQFLYNPQLSGNKRVFIKVRTNKEGEFRNSVVRGNHFVRANGQPLTRIIAGATFTGDSVFERNYPGKFNHIKIEPIGHNTKWKEDHPVVQDQAHDKDQHFGKIKKGKNGVKIVTLPLSGHQYNFSTGKILPYKHEGKASVIFHIDPIMADGHARVERLGQGALLSYVGKTLPDRFGDAVWGYQKGDVIAVKTQSGKIWLFKVLDLQRKQITISYVPFSS